MKNRLSGGRGPTAVRFCFGTRGRICKCKRSSGLPPDVHAIRESLPIFCKPTPKATYKPDVALIYGTQVENTDLFPPTATFANEWNQSYAYPKLNYATFPDFFHYLDQHYGKDLPIYKGDGGSYWEDGIGSDAYFATEDRRNQNRVLSAEILSSVTHTVDANLNPPAGLLATYGTTLFCFPSTRGCLITP